MEDKSRIYALCGTLAVVALLVAILLFAALSYPPAERPRWDVDKSEVLLADEYVPMDRIIPSDIGDDEPVAGDLVEGPDAAPGQASSVDIDDAGDIGAASPVNTASEPSAVKETVKPESVKPATPRKTTRRMKRPGQGISIPMSITRLPRALIILQEIIPGHSRHRKAAIPPVRQKG